MSFAKPFGLTLLGLVLLASLPASALIMSGTGNQPVHDYGWPEGALKVANLESRLGWWEGPPFGGGEWHFLYHGNTEAFQKALTAFAAIRAPALDFVLHDGPHEDGILKKQVDWTFTVWVPANWHSLFNNPKSVFEADQPNFRQPVAPPRLDVYVGSGVDWAKVKVPPGLSVRDERAPAVNPTPGAILRADIYDMATGKPVAGAKVSIIGRLSAGASRSEEEVTQAVSDATGHVEITIVPPGTYGLRVGADGYATRALSYERYGESTSRKLTVELAKAASIRGTVTDSEGKPLQGVKVNPFTVMALNGRGYTLPERPEAVSGPDGVFALTNLPTGFTQFQIYRPGYYFGDVFTIHDVPGTNIVLRLTRAGGLHVTVTDKAGRPLSHLEGKPLYVAIEPVGGSNLGSWGGGGTVKDGGTLEFENMPPGQYRITSRPNPSTSNRQYTPEQTVTVAPGGATQVKVVYAADRAEGEDATSLKAIDDFTAEQQTKSAKPAPKQPEPNSK